MHWDCICWSQVQAEVKKAWLRRSLALDIKQKARVVSSTGGGSCYYGGMTSHTTTQSICLVAQGPILSRGVASGVRGQSHVADLPGYTPTETSETALPRVPQLRRIDSTGALYHQNDQNVVGPQEEYEEEEEEEEKEPALCFIAEDHSSSMKDLETILWKTLSDHFKPGQIAAFILSRNVKVKCLNCNFTITLIKTTDATHTFYLITDIYLLNIPSCALISPAPSTSHPSAAHWSRNGPNWDFTVWFTDFA